MYAASRLLYSLYLVTQPAIRLNNFISSLCKHMCVCVFDSINVLHVQLNTITGRDVMQDVGKKRTAVSIHCLHICRRILASDVGGRGFIGEGAVVSLTFISPPL